MGAIRLLARAAALAAGLVLLGVGGLGLALVHAPGHPSVEASVAALERAYEAGSGHGSVRPRAGAPSPLTPREALTTPALRYGLSAGGALLCLLALRLGRRRRLAHPEAPPRLDRRTRRRVAKQARALRRQGLSLEAAEMLHEAGFEDAAAEAFLEAGEATRAAEIRQRQGRLVEAAELCERAEDFESAARLLREAGETLRAARCFEQAGQPGVAAELLAEAGRFEEAAEGFAKVGLHRQAADAWLHCGRGLDAAAALETLVGEETRFGLGVRDAEGTEALRRLGLQAGALFEEAGRLDRAQAVLTQAGCPGAAAAQALARERYDEAGELFLRAGDAPRAADALRRQGRERDAARVLAEHHRERGELAEAASHAEAAGDLEAAADFHRQLGDDRAAAALYERAGEALQAAELYESLGDIERAAASFEVACKYDDAARCWGALGRRCEQAEMLSRAGFSLGAAEVLLEAHEEDAALVHLQKVPEGHADHIAATLQIAQILRRRGLCEAAMQRLRNVLSDAGVSAENVALFELLGALLEEAGRHEEAASFYEHILGFDCAHGDVAARLESIRQLAGLRTASAAGPRRPPGAEGTPGARRYEVLEELGRGGMAVVYKARDVVLDRIVAWKVLPDSLKANPQALRNFLREAKSAARLNHPNIVTIHDAGEQDGSLYIAMEYVDGTTLKQIVRRRGAVSIKGVLYVLVQMCEALSYAHEKKVVHRDIKTANVMWTQDRQLKVMDFGLAKMLEEVRPDTTIVAGTPFYMSPEQSLGGPVDHRSDLYSLGVTLFELATGQLPFAEPGVAQDRLQQVAPDSRELRPEVPAGLAGILARCLRRRPDERYASAREILADARGVRLRG